MKGQYPDMVKGSTTRTTPLMLGDKNMENKTKIAIAAIAFVMVAITAYAACTVYDDHDGTNDYSVVIDNPGDNIYAIGAPMCVSNIPIGYHFDHWSGSDGNNYQPGDIITLSPEMPSITLTAVFAIDTFTVTWQNYNGTVLETDTVDYGTTPSYSGSTPVKASTECYDYTFCGWFPWVGNIYYDMTYVAQFYATPVTYGVTFNEGVNTTITGNATATYGTDYTFTVSADNGAPNSLIAVSVTIGGVDHDATYVNGHGHGNSYYLIDGDAIIGDISITTSPIYEYTVTYDVNGHITSETYWSNGDQDIIVNEI